MQVASEIQVRAAGREQGERHVSFENERGDEQSTAGPASTPLNLRGRPPRVPPPASAVQATSSPDADVDTSLYTAPLSFSLPPSRLGGQDRKTRVQAGMATTVDPARTSILPATSGSDGGGSEMSLTLNASMRRTRRRHAAAAAAMMTGNVLGPAPVPAAAAIAVAAAAAARAANGSGATPAGSLDSSGAAREGTTGAAATLTAAKQDASKGTGGGDTETGTPGGGGSGAVAVASDGYTSVAAAVLADNTGEESVPPAASTPPICGPLYTKPTPPNVLAITIAQSEAFRLDPLLTNPVVRVHCLDVNTGQYLASLDDPSIGLIDGARAVQILEYAGRPSQMTVANNSDYPAASILRAIPPIQTRPFNLLSRPEARTMAAWEETLLIDEAAERFVALDPLLIFEVLQPPVSYQRYNKHIRAFDAEDGSHLVAWAFLRPSGPRPETPDGPRQPLFGRLKLQLYEYKKDISDAVRVSSKAAEAAAAPPSAGAGTVVGTAGAPGPLHLNAASRAYVNWQALMAEGGAAVVPKYPSALTVVLQAVRRPEPEVVITEPAFNIRPYLPAGYGSGFETSKVPLSAYLGGEGGEGDTLFGEAANDITKHKLYRPITEPCKVPNVPLRKLPGGPQGVTCLAFSHGGLYLAVVASEADDGARIVIYHALTGAPKRTIHGAHNGFVYEVAWARDDSAIITASADGTAKVWEFNPAAAAAAMEAAVEAAAGGRGTSVADAAEAAAAAAPTMNLLATMMPRGTAAATAALAAANPNLNASKPAAADGGGGNVSITSSGSVPAPALAGFKAGATATLPHATVLNHACYVYTAQFHPVQKLGSALVATGAYDGTVRLWRRYTGELLAAVKTQSGCINSLCFDKLGTRLYAGDSAGVLQEFSCDISKGADAVAAAPGGTNLKISTISASGNNSAGTLNATLMSSTMRKRLSGTQRSAGGGGSPSPVNLNASMLPRSNFNFTASLKPTPAAAGSGDGDGSQTAQSRDGAGVNASPGSTATAGGAEVAVAAAAAAAAAASNILRVLRQCDEFDGEPLAHVFPHYDGRRLGLLTKRSRLLVVETRSLSKAEQFLGLRCREGPLKATFSPDGRYLVCGSEDGRVFTWDADGGPPTKLPQWTLGGDAVYQVAWNPQFHIAAVCSFASWAPVLLLAYDSSQPDVALQIGHKNSLELMARDRKRMEKPRPRWDIPDQLTPEFLRIMLSNIRRDARERGIIGDPNDPNGEYLIVPRKRLAELHAKQEADLAAAAAPADGAAPPAPATPPPPPALANANVDAASLPELPRSRFQTMTPAEAADEGDLEKNSLRSEKTKSNVHFADDLPPPAFKEPRPASPPPPAVLAEEPGQSPPAAVPAVATEALTPAMPQLQEYQWSHPQPQKQQLEAAAQKEELSAPLTPPPPSWPAASAATPPTRLRQQQQEYARQQFQAAQQQRWRYPAATAAVATLPQPQPQVPYTRTLYGLEQQYEWQKEVQAPDRLQYSQLQRAAEQELREGPRQYPPQPREVQLYQYALQQQQQQRYSAQPQPQQQQTQQQQHNHDLQQHYGLQQQAYALYGLHEPSGQYGPAAFELYQMQTVPQVQPAVQVQRQQQQRQVMLPQQELAQQQQLKQGQQLQYGAQQGYELKSTYMPTATPHRYTPSYLKQRQQHQQLHQLPQQPQSCVGDQEGYGMQPPPYYSGQPAHEQLPYAQRRPHSRQQRLQQYGTQSAQQPDYGLPPSQYAQQLLFQQQQQYVLQPQHGGPQVVVHYR
ncbi:hypothetical protein VaNZ11_013953 [Volvox africanus]|uniref:Anaphase-promoting complex subunit 4 WD40 domain-containing protein n=1 Tax=Volvox africanus TaxID=51714 RepID=A0ABQ5SHD4_9CHLO|nr:hypothetical protein VaNZ11_013953 [Volvox africanus]